MGTIVRKKDTGEPGNKGQFGRATRTGSGLTLAAHAPVAAPPDHEVNADGSWPQPQANDLDKVAAAVDAVEAGAVTYSAVAHALGVSEREGGYYAAAAGYLGLLEREPGSDLTVLRPTSLGRQLTATDGTDRAALIAGVVANVPAVQSVLDGDQEAVADSLVRDGLSDVTAHRRLATARSWAAQIRDSDTLAARTREAASAVRGRAREAGRIAQEELRAARSAARTQARPTPVCPECFMQVPTSGVCDCGYQSAA